MMREDICIKVLEVGSDFREKLNLSHDFFYEYEDYHKEFFKIDTLSDSDIINYFNSFLNSEERKAFIAVKDGHIVAYITVYIKEQPSYWKVKKVGEISGLMVHKDFRRIGIADELLKSAKDFFKGKYVSYYSLFTSVNNIKGIEFYKKCGLYPLQTVLIGEV